MFVKPLSTQSHVMIALADGALEGARVGASVLLETTIAPIVFSDNLDFVVTWHRVDAAVFCPVVAVTKGTGV